MIRVERLSKRFGLHHALRELSLQIDEGEIVALLGPNGAGKTTLLRILATLARPTSGRILIHGSELDRGWSELRRHIGLVSHQSLLYPELTADENLQLYGHLYGVEPLVPRIDEVLEWVGLRSRRRDPVRHYSRGMVQRLAIARALLHDPQLLLLDEPFGGLDELAANGLETLLRRLMVEEPARIVLIATHDLNRALSLATRLVILRQGRVVTDAPRAAHDEPGWRAAYLQHAA